MSLERRRLTHEIAAAIQEQIADLGLHGGDRMPSHAVLAEQLGISVPSLREGLQTLAAMGVVEMEHGRGTIVRRPSLAAFIAGVHPVLLARSYTVDECITTVSAILDRAVDDLVRVQRRERPLSAALAELEIAGDAVAVSSALQQFYYDLVYPLHQALTTDLVLLVTRLIVNTPLTGRSLVANSPKLRSILRSFAAAIENGDTREARRVLMEHEGLLRRLVPEDQQLACATGSIGGTFYTAGLELAHAVQAGGSYVLRPVPSAGGIENVSLLQSGRIQIAFTQEHVADAAFRGAAPFEDAFTDLRSIGRTHSLDLWIVTSASSGITSLCDIQGRRIAMGTRGGETSRISSEILSAYGHDGSTYEQRFLSISQASEALERGEIDLLFYLTGGMGSALAELSETHDLRVLPVDEPIREAVCSRQPSWQSATIQTGMEADPVTTVRVETLLVARADLPDEVAAQLWTALRHAADTSRVLNPAAPADSCVVPRHEGVKSV